MASRLQILGALCIFQAAFGADFPAIPDSVFMQELGESHASKTALKTVAVHHGRVFVGSAEGISEFKDGNFQAEAEAKAPVEWLKVLGRQLWASTTEGLLLRTNHTWLSVTTNRVSDLVEFNQQIYAGAGRQLWTFQQGSLSLASTNDAPFSMAHLAGFNDSIYLLGGNRITFFDGRQFGGKDMYEFPADLGWDWGNLPSTKTTSLLADGPRLLIGTDRGLSVLRGMSLTSLRGDDGLPFEDITCLGAGFTNDVWIGTSRGAIRQVKGEFHYFAGKRWLPHDRVNAIAASDRAVYIATDGGLGIIHFEPLTLEKKAEYYEKHLERWGQKRLGFLHKLEWDEGLKEFVREISDNDGGYSGDYLAAQSYRFALTHDPVARREAVNTFHALRWLEQLTGIRGFPARSMWVKEEKGHKAMGGSGGYPAEWHDSADARFEWKGDTSSDELCSHFYAVSVFLELVAQGAEIEQGKVHLQKMADHLIDHRWQLIDVDGKPTRWGRWDPEYFLTDEGRFDRGLQAVELLSFVKTAAVLTDGEKYRNAYSELLKLGYPQYTLRQRAHFPTDSVLHFEDQLAFWSYWNLLRAERDPALRSVYRRSFERTWEMLRIEHQPWLNFVYGALTGNDCESAEAVKHLREWPLDLRIWSYQNSHRADLRTPAGYVALKAGIRPFSPREREPMRWDGWTMQADGGAGGRDVVEPSGWLLAYWMGRYYNFIEAPRASDSTLLSKIEPASNQGAKPYNGPQRPTDF